MSKKKTAENTDCHYFIKDSMARTERYNMRWYHRNLMKVLNRAKENHARDMDGAIALTKKLIKNLDEKLEPPVVVPLREVEQSQDDSLMKPIDPEVLDRFYKSRVKGGDVEYLKERNQLAPEDKFFFRIVSSWDYGWQQKAARVKPRDVNHGRCAILRDTFYRKNNLSPDPPHYTEPSGGEISICSQYSCIN